MRFYAALIFVLLGVGCRDSNQSNNQPTEVKNDTLRTPEKMDTDKNLSNMLDHVLRSKKIFTGKHRVIYEDGSSRSIEIDSFGNISGSKNYKLFRVVANGQNIIYLIKGKDEVHSPKDTFSYAQQDNGVQLYLINNHQKTYKYTLTKITQ